MGELSLTVGRYYGPGLKPFGPLSKPVKLASKKYLGWVAKQPCIVTGKTGDNVIVHHVQRKSQGLNDYITVPMLATLHTELHSSDGVATFENKHSIDFRDAVIAKLVERIHELEQAN